jgi:hypothetical protein
METEQPLQGGGVLPSYWDDDIKQIIEIFHILQEFIEQWWIEKKVKRVRKKGSTICPLEKVRLEGSPFFHFFRLWNKKAIPKRSPSGTKPTYNVLAK